MLKTSGFIDCAQQISDNCFLFSGFEYDEDGNRIPYLKILNTDTEEITILLN